MKLSDTSEESSRQQHIFVTITTRPQSTQEILSSTILNKVVVTDYILETMRADAMTSEPDCDKPNGRMKDGVICLS